MKKLPRQHPSVRKLFQEQIMHYSRAEQATVSPIVDHFLDWVKKKKSKCRLKVCEFGGGAGQVLARIEKYYPHAKLINAEIVADYQKHLYSPKIRFVKKSILNSDFPDQSFDVLIIRDLLHHLVGRNYQESLENQRRALQELKRLIRPGGAIFIDEYTNGSEMATKIIYFLSKLNSKLGLNFPSFQISSNAIVAFLTPGKLKQLCYSTFGKRNVIKESQFPVKAKLTSRLLHLGARLERTIMVVEEPIQ